MPKLHEVIDSLNNENAEDLRETLKSEASALEKENSRLYARAKKAEGCEKIDGKWIKKEIKTEPQAKTETPGEFDYGQKAFLAANGVKGADELAKVKDFQSATGKSLEEIMESKYFLSELQELRDDKAAKAAMPEGSRGARGGSAKDSIEYYLSKGEMPPADRPELRRQYVNERYKKEKSVSHFAR